MRGSVRAAALATLAVLLAGCQSQAGPADAGADAEAIRAVEDAMRAAYKAKDAEALAALYAPDATLYSASERPRVGAQALLEGLRKDMTDPAFAMTFTTGKTQVAASGDLGYSRGSFTVRYTNPTTGAAASYSGYYLTVFRKQPDGRWAAVEDMAVPAS